MPVCAVLIGGLAASPGAGVKIGSRRGGETAGVKYGGGEIRWCVIEWGEIWWCVIEWGVRQWGVIWQGVAEVLRCLHLKSLSRRPTDRLTG